MNWNLLKSFLFSLDPETAHNLGLSAIESGLLKVKPPTHERLITPFLNTTLSHPLGLSAGMDKNGTAINHWEDLGFSFAEAGTVTPLPQSGNEKPRLFRLLQDEGLINRLGFNNKGVKFLKNQLDSRETKIPIGANIGKNKTTDNKDAPKDYEVCAKTIADSSDFIVINVSSPNTPGLRSLQSTEELRKIIGATISDVPLFVKISPDLSDDNLEEIVLTSISEGVSGIVATNTTISRENLKSNNSNETGGLSGRPLKQLANEICKKTRQIAGDKTTIVGSGGIFTGEDLYERMKSGANVCQIYTAFVYRGPNAVSLILNEYLDRLLTE